MGSIIADGRRAALQIAEIIRAADGAELVVEPELDIVCAFPRRPTSSQISAATEDAFAAMAQDGWHLALYRVDSKWLARNHPWLVVDSDYTTVLRSCAMKPEHLQRGPRIQPPPHCINGATALGQIKAAAMSSVQGLESGLPLIFPHVHPESSTDSKAAGRVPRSSTGVGPGHDKEVSSGSSQAPWPPPAVFSSGPVQSVAKRQVAATGTGPGESAPCWQVRIVKISGNQASSSEELRR